MKDIGITPETHIYDLLEKYPQLEEKLIQTAPVFSKLKNPVLRRTITRVTTLRQAAVVGGVRLADLINVLRKEAGLTEMIIESGNNVRQDAPEWLLESNVTMEYDARADLENGFHPAAKVSAAVAGLNKGVIYKLTTPFIPAPLIDMIKAKGAQAYVKQVSENEVETYFTNL